MENILILGAAGNIGYDLLLKLLETNYIITVLDLKSKYNEKRLNMYSDKVNVIYGDIEDKNLIRDLITKNDIVINYAGIMPPLASFDSNIAESTNYLGNKNVVDCIKEVNPNCMYFYMSFISVYGNTKKQRKLNVESKLDDHDDLFTISLIRSENYIKENLSRFAIIRMPIVLTPDNYFLRHLRIGYKVDFITCDDLNKSLISLLKNRSIEGKIFNISGFKANSKDFLKELYKVTGKAKICNRTLYYGEFEDDSVLDEITGVDKTTFKEFLDTMNKKYPSYKRRINKVFNYLKYLIIKKSAR